MSWPPIIVDGTRPCDRAKIEELKKLRAAEDKKTEEARRPKTLLEQIIPGAVYDEAVEATYNRSARGFGVIKKVEDLERGSEQAASTPEAPASGWSQHAARDKAKKNSLNIALPNNAQAQAAMELVTASYLTEEFGKDAASKGTVTDGEKRPKAGPFTRSKDN